MGELDELGLEVADLRASRRRLALAHDAERRDIERSFHDGVQQQLVGLATGVELAAGSVDTDPAATRKLLSEIGREMQRTLEEARSLAHRIYPPLLEAGGLLPALRSAAVTANIPIRLDVADDLPYPPEIAGLIYACCQQVLRHAGAGTPVSVTVRGDDRTADFVILADGDLDDDGIALRDRVEALGGRLSVDGGSDHRTRVTGSVPRSG